MPRLIVCLVAAAAAFDACTQKDAQGRRPLRCCPGEPYTIAVLQGERKDGRLQQMYRPIHETLRVGLAAREHECGYQVKIARTTGRSIGVAQSLRAGDVLIWIGVHHEEQFLRGKNARWGKHLEGGAPALAGRGVYVISYQTEFFPLVAYRGAAEVWTYTHATHFRRKAPRRYPKRVVPPGFVAPLFAPPPLADSGPARELTFFGTHRAGRECPKYERDKGRVPAGGAIPLKIFNNVWRQAEWERVTRERRASAYISFHKHCGNSLSPLESFRLSQLLSFGALVVAEDSDAADVALYKDIVIVERDFYREWSPETRDLLADGAAILAFKQKALALYKQRFAPLALLQKVDAWNERHEPRHWLDPVSWAGACHMFPPFECNGKRMRPGQVPEPGAPARRRLQDAFDACAPRGGRRPLRCCPGEEEYTVAVMHGERGDGKLKLMYAPIRKTLAGGLRARMNECGYRVTKATTLQEAGDAASRLKSGDVALWLGIHQERNFMRLAPRLAAKGVYVISYQTDYFPLKAYPGAAETWSYTHATHYAKRAQRLPRRVVPPGYVQPPFPPPQIDAAPANTLTFVGKGRGGRDKRCPREFVGRPPANGALPVTNINSAWSDDEWARVARERRASAFLTYHQRCGDARAPLESFRLSQILSFGGFVVAENSDAEDVSLFEDIVRVEKKFYGDWSQETRQLLADGDALAAYKRRAYDLYRRRFAPEALLRRVDAWNERGAPDDWQDTKST